jgi:hypothetical protein
MGGVRHLTRKRRHRSKIIQSLLEIRCSHQIGNAYLSIWEQESASEPGRQAFDDLVADEGEDESPSEDRWGF